MRCVVLAGEEKVAAVPGEATAVDDVIPSVPHHASEATDVGTVWGEPGKAAATSDARVDPEGGHRTSGPRTPGQSLGAGPEDRRDRRR